MDADVSRSLCLFWSKPCLLSRVTGSQPYTYWLGLTQRMKTQKRIKAGSSVQNWDRNCGTVAGAQVNIRHVQTHYKQTKKETQELKNKAWQHRWNKSGWNKAKSSGKTKAGSRKRERDRWQNKTGINSKPSHLFNWATSALPEWRSKHRSDVFQNECTMIIMDIVYGS